MAVAGAHLLDCVLVEEVQADMLGALHVIVQRVPADGIDRREILSNARSLQPMLSSISCRTDTRIAFVCSDDLLDEPQIPANNAAD